MQTFTFTVDGKTYNIEAASYKDARMQLEEILKAQ